MSECQLVMILQTWVGQRLRPVTNTLQLASLQLARANMCLPIHHFLSAQQSIFGGVVQFAAVFLSGLSRVRFSVWTWSTSQSCCRNLDSPQTNSWRWEVHLEQRLGLAAIRTSPSSVCVSAGQNHEAGGSQLVSGSSFPPPQHPENRLMHLFWRNLTAQTSWMSRRSQASREILNSDLKPQ